MATKKTSLAHTDYFRYDVVNTPEKIPNERCMLESSQSLLFPLSRVCVDTLLFLLCVCV